jgi:hypothetical protein
VNRILERRTETKSETRMGEITGRCPAQGIVVANAEVRKRCNLVFLICAIHSGATKIFLHRDPSLYFVALIKLDRILHSGGNRG